jgi:CheY-like chemotaxis protein
MDPAQPGRGDLSLLLFLSQVAHELRNPLGAISSGVAVLRQPGPHPEAQVARVAEIIERQTRQLAHLMNELTDISRVATGQVTIDRPLPGPNSLLERCRRAAEQAGTEPAQPADARAPEPAAAPAPGRRRIVLIEDNEDLAETLRELLEELGHEVATARDGQQGVEQVLALRPDIALIDLGLPDFDGFEVARRIRAAIPSGTLLVAMTGYGRPEDLRRTQAAGFDAHLTKPPKLDVLQRLLTEGKI